MESLPNIDLLTGLLENYMFQQQAVITFLVKLSQTTLPQLQQ